MAIKGVYGVIVIWVGIFWHSFVLIIALFFILMHVISDKVCHHLPISMQSVLITNELLIFIF